MKVVGILLLASMAVAYNPNIYANMDSDEPYSAEHGVSAGKKGTTCNCGWANRDMGRIVNGRETGVNQFPFAVYIEMEINETMISQCGGTIISEYHVLTAAHCTKGYSPDKVTVVVGEHDLYTTRETDATRTIGVKTIINHKDYNVNRGEDNDIALLELKSKIQFNSKVGPACLPSKKYQFNLVDKYVKVMGWGAIEYQGDTSNVLLQTNLRVISLDVCNQMYRKVSKVNPTQICTFSKQRDSCQGDSGGPVVYVDPETNRYTLIGVVSYGRVCASNDPGVNTDVSVYLDWIHSNMKATNANGKTCSKK